jgi:hypothetical protein
MTFIAPLVLSRTLNMDFRYLALPGQLAQDQLNELQRFVWASLRYPESLRSRERWVFVRRGDVALVGVVCENRMLALNAGVPDYSKDSVGRDIYAFAGFVLRPLSGPCPFIPRDFAAFSELLDYVGKHWLEDPAARWSASRRESVAVDEPFREMSRTYERQSFRAHTLNHDAERVLVHPENVEHDLWCSAFEATGSFSVCLGMPGRRDAHESSFGNTTIIGGREMMWWDREPSAVASGSPASPSESVSDGWTRTPVGPKARLSDAGPSDAKPSEPDERHWLDVLPNAKPSEPDERHWLDVLSDALKALLHCLKQMASVEPDPPPDFETPRTSRTLPKGLRPFDETSTASDPGPSRADDRTSGKPR